MTWLDGSKTYAIGWMLALVGALAIAPTPAASSTARSHAVVAGSSTIFPLAAAVAERLAGPPTLVMPMGSGAGIAWFCEGLGPATPDVVMASRPMLPEELAACERAGVAPLTQVEIGRDGIVLAAAPGSPVKALALGELWSALGAVVPDASGRWVSNPARRWAELSADLPDVPIQVLGPPATSGTRDALVSLALRPACLDAVARFPQGAPDPSKCGELRRDGVWLEAGESDDALVARLAQDGVALGVLGYGSLRRHGERIVGVCLEGHCPSTESIATGEYPLSRPLYLYLKPGHATFVPGLDALVDGFLDPAAIGEAGYLARLGLIPGRQARVQLLDSAGTGQAVVGSPLRVQLLAAALLTVVILLAAGLVMVRRAKPVHRSLERWGRVALAAGTGLAGALLAVLLATLVLPTIGFFLQVSPRAFLTGTAWSPETAIRAAQVVGEGAFGVLPVLLGSVLVAVIALVVALPLSLAAALRGYAWAGTRERDAWRVGLRLAALVPTVVFGLFAALTAGPFIASLASGLGMSAGMQGLLAAGMVVGIMLMPVMAARVSEALATVPAAAAESALGLGATRWETLRDVVLPCAAPGIGAGILLAIGRALGETMIVLMAVGLAATRGPAMLDAGTTLTVQMVALMSGTHDLGHVRTQLPFVLGMLLAIVILPLNALALRLLRKTDGRLSPVL